MKRKEKNEYMKEDRQDKPKRQDRQDRPEKPERPDWEVKMGKIQFCLLLIAGLYLGKGEGFKK